MLEVQECTRLANAAEAEAEAATVRFTQSESMLGATLRTITDLRRSLVELTGSHSELQRSYAPSREVQRQRLRTDESECDTATSAKADRRALLAKGASALQRRRAAYADRLEKLKETAAALSTENAQTSRNCERLRVVIAEMYSHAEVLACQLEAERKRHGELSREVAAIEQATNEVQQQATTKSRGARVGRENTSRSSSPVHAASKAGVTSGGAARRKGLATN
jgi:chromosome segregation ATPase